MVGIREKAVEEHAGNGQREWLSEGPQETCESMPKKGTNRAQKSEMYIVGRTLKK